MEFRKYPVEVVRSPKKKDLGTMAKDSATTALHADATDDVHGTERVFIPQSRRASHLDNLIRTNRASMSVLSVDVDDDLLEEGEEEEEYPDAAAAQAGQKDDASTPAATPGNQQRHHHQFSPTAAQEELVGPSSTETERRFQHLLTRMSVYQTNVPDRLVEVRVQNYSYAVPIRMDAPTVKTVANQVCLFLVFVMPRVRFACWVLSVLYLCIACRRVHFQTSTTFSY
jgi:hypothetical protein